MTSNTEEISNITKLCVPLSPYGTFVGLIQMSWFSQKTLNMSVGNSLWAHLLTAYDTKRRKTFLESMCQSSWKDSDWFCSGHMPTSEPITIGKGAKQLELDQPRSYSIPEASVFNTHQNHRRVILCLPSENLLADKTCPYSHPHNRGTSHKQPFRQSTVLGFVKENKD